MHCNGKAPDDWEAFKKEEMAQDLADELKAGASIDYISGPDVKDVSMIQSHAWIRNFLHEFVQQGIFMTKN
jgi:hypothetical protein